MRSSRRSRTARAAGRDAARRAREAQKEKARAQAEVRIARIRDEGAAAVGAAIKARNSLTSVVLLFNQIGAEGAAALGAAIKASKRLTQDHHRSKQILLYLVS